MNKLEKALKKAGYELVGNSIDLEGVGLKVIKPLRKVEKQTSLYKLEFYENYKLGKLILDKDFEFTESQAELVGDAIEALMEFIQSKEGHAPEPYYTDVAEAAREALEGTE